MTTAPDPVESSTQAKQATTLGVIDTLVVGWTFFAVVDAAALLLLRPRPRGWPASLAHATAALYDLGHALLLGLVVAALWQARARWLPRHRAITWVGVAALSLVTCALTLREDLALPAEKLAQGGNETVWLSLLIGGCAAAIALASGAARLLARRRWRLVPLLGAAATASANYVVLQGDYPGAHLLAALVAGGGASAALFGAPRPRWLPATRWLAVAAWIPAFVAAAVPPPNRARVRLSGTWSSALAPILPRAVVQPMLARARSSGALGAFGVAGATPPTTPGISPTDPIVIYFSVDSLRADLLEQKRARDLPNIHALARESVTFTQARTPGSQTVYTLTEVMSGTYFSQQYWTRKYVPEGKGFHALWPHEDETPRFPAVLASAGIPTVQYGQAVWLLNEFGMTRGFTEEKFVKPKAGKKWSTGDMAMEAILKRLKRHAGGPLFLFFHDLDPHSPFDLGKRKGGTYQKYLGEVQLTDRRLGRLRKVLQEKGLEDRAIIIFTADHGEAFGEHGTSFHGQNLYDEQVRVPLLVHVPGVRPRKVDASVTIMDLGPTILDLMGVATPSHFMAQSLVPFLQGDKPELHRAVVAEGRMKQSMVLPSGYKVIRDQKNGSFEIYDLKKDPGELENLYDELGEKGDALMSELDGFFEQHKIRRAGYEIPFRR